MAVRISRPRRLAAVVSVVATMAVLAGCSDAAPIGTGGRANDGGLTDPGLGHVHGVGLNPADGHVYAATHFGVFGIPVPGSTGSTASASDAVVRVADRWQDTMGFTVAGPDEFFGSGHPDLREDLPGLLGFMVSRDRARTWTKVALLGTVDFHDLAVAGTGDLVYGYNATGGQLLVSADTGASWRPRARLEIRDLTVDPGQPRHLLAATADGLVESVDGGRTFAPLPAAPRLLALDWSGGRRPVLAGATADGAVWASPAGTDPATAGSWERRGQLMGQPQAFDVTADGRLLAADDRGVTLSVDGGDRWKLLARYGLQPGPSADDRPEDSHGDGAPEGRSTAR